MKIFFIFIYNLNNLKCYYLKLIVFFLGCALNRLLTFYNKGPCRISSVSIVPEIPSLDKKIDEYRKNVVHGNLNNILIIIILLWFWIFLQVNLI